MLVNACTPALNWREVRPEASGLVALFPCKPESYERSLVLAGEARRMTLYVCEAQGATYALSYAELEDERAVSSSLAALRQSAIDNISATIRHETPINIAGMTCNSGAHRLHLVGHLPSGLTAEADAAFFCHGARVFQATVIAPGLDPDAIDAFISGLHFGS